MNHTAKKLLVGTVGAAGLFLATTATANADTTHKVAKNDTVWDLSQKYGVSIQAIEALNNIDQNSHLIITGQTLKVPAKDAQVSENNNTAQATDKKADTENTSDVTVKAGDTLWTLAQQYNTSVEKLRELNGLAADAYLIHPGNVLKINGTVQATQQPAQTEQPVQQQAQPEQPVVQQQATQEQAQEPQLVVSANHTTHTVQAGESLYSIAQAYGVTVDSLRAANNLGATLLVGQTLTINDPAKDPAQEAAAQQAAAQQAAAQAQQEAAAQQAAQQQAAAQAQQEAAAQQATQQQAATQVQQPVQNQAPAQTQAPAQQTQQVQQQAQPAQVQQPQQQVVSTSADGAAIAAYAQSFIGTPYVWGGSTPSGFDCSGLTQYVYAHFGKQIGRNTIAQESAGAHIPVSQAQVGDLLFWGTPGSTYHVAIYLGGNSFVAAPEPGQSVKIGNMAYFMPSFAVHVN